ncbi:hypothetical protein HYY69_03095 [Candidatus Woesearchaeota archaeon]|nr:hypothetical protein [Candidatus Woesearchaeota archaeon]
MTDYFQELGTAIKLFGKNLNIFWFLLVGLVYLLIILGLGGLFFWILLLASGNTLSTINNINIMSIQFIVVGMVELMIWLLVIMILGNYITSMTFGFLKEIAIKGFCPFKKAFYYGNIYWKTYFKYSLLYTFGLIGIPLLIIGLLIVFALLANEGALQVIFGVLAGILAIVFVVYAIFLYFSQFFARVMIVTQNTGVLETLKRSYQYLLKNPIHVFATFGIMLLVIVPLSIVMFMFSLLEFIPYAIFITTPLEQLLGFVVSMVVALFMMRSYIAENRIKN